MLTFIIQNEIVTDKNTALTLGEIVSASMEELVRCMDDLDVQSAQLYSKLNMLDAELRRDTDEFEEEIIRKYKAFSIY